MYKVTYEHGIEAINNKVYSLSNSLRNVSTELYSICCDAGFPEKANRVFVCTDDLCNEMEKPLSKDELAPEIPAILKVMPALYLKMLYEIIDMKTDCEACFQQDVCDARGCNHHKEEAPFSIVKNGKVQEVENDNSNEGKGELLNREIVDKIFMKMLKTYADTLTRTQYDELHHKWKERIEDDITYCQKGSLSYYMFYISLLNDMLKEIDSNMKQNRKEDEEVNYI